jgi:retron-type reverse transcriptase
MKRHGNLFNQIIELDNLWEAYRKARKGKSSKSAVKRFESSPEKRIIKIRDSLIDNTFTTSEYQTKWVYEPKPRLIYVLPFNPDRVVQHAIMNIVEPIWDKLFIDDSYACRVGKGIHKGSKRCMEFTRKYKYCLKCDISKFYPSINHDILFNIIQHKIKCKQTLNLLSGIIYSIEGENNIPIGNYTSQWFGNLYLNELDIYLKHTHHIKPYLRYCDDFVIFDDSKFFLNELTTIIKDFVGNNLKLTLSKCDLFPVSRGVDFLGYRHFKDYLTLRKSTAKRIKSRLTLLPKLLKQGKITVESYKSSIMSTLGWLKHCSTYNFRNNLCINENLNVY